jgi:hypothetical protein
VARERDNPAERLARIDKLMAENKPTPAAQQIARLQASLMVVSLPKGPSLDTRDLSEAETRTRSGMHLGQAGSNGQAVGVPQPSNERRLGLFYEPRPPCYLCESPRIACVGLVEDVGFFRCEDCDEVFTIQLAARAVEVAHDAHIET